MLVTDLPQRLQRETSSGAYDTGAPGTLLGKPVVVKIHADGVTGYGQIRPISPGHFMPDTVHSMVGAITEIYGPRLLGKDLLDTESILALFDRALPANMNARAALDHALHDAIGKALKLPAYKLLGGLAQERIPLEWSVSMAADPAKMVADAERAMRQFGIRVLCLKAGGKGGWRRDVENFITVRKAVGVDVTIGVDPNEGWTVSEAIRAVHALARDLVAEMRTGGGPAWLLHHQRRRYLLPRQRRRRSCPSRARLARRRRMPDRSLDDDRHGGDPAQPQQSRCRLPCPQRCACGGPGRRQRRSDGQRRFPQTRPDGHEVEDTD